MLVLQINSLFNNLCPMLILKDLYLTKFTYLSFWPFYGKSLELIVIWAINYLLKHLWINSIYYAYLFILFYSHYLYIKLSEIMTCWSVFHFRETSRIQTGWKCFWWRICIVEKYILKMRNDFLKCKCWGYSVTWY